MYVKIYVSEGRFGHVTKLLRLSCCACARYPAAETPADSWTRTEGPVQTAGGGTVGHTVRTGGVLSR